MSEPSINTPIFSLVTYMEMLHPDWSREQVKAAAEARLSERLDVMQRTIHTVFIDTCMDYGALSTLEIARLQHPDWAEEQLIAEAEEHLAGIRDYEMGG